MSRQIAKVMIQVVLIETNEAGQVVDELVTQPAPFFPGKHHDLWAAIADLLPKDDSQ